MPAPLNFADPQWAEHLRCVALENGREKSGEWIDYFAFSRELYGPEIPPFVLRVFWDNWLVADYFPDVRWAHYTSSYDGGTGGQTGFYNVMLEPSPIDWVTWWTKSCAWNSIMVQQAHDTYDDISPTTDNYRYYIGTGSRHTMWGSNKVYSDTTGGVPTLVDWVNGMLDGTPAWTNVECTNCGLLLPGDPAPSPLQAPFSLMGTDIVVTCP